jgi:hydrogenase expression/formation protein HypD
MDVLQEFKNNQIVQKEIEYINALSEKLKKTASFMEVCGTHTMQISKFGIRKLMPKNIKLISGPGCPVCVTPQEYIDKAIYILRNYDVIIVTFGDLYRVPGSESSLEKEKANGKDVRIVYSVEEALSVAGNSKKPVVFLSIGFETTMPAIACIVKEAKQKNVKNLFFLLGNKFFIPAMEKLILLHKKEKTNLDGFILPGHLSSIIGQKPYLWIKQKYNLAGVITGFEPVDIVLGIKILLEMLVNNNIDIKNEYTRVVTFEGNTYAQKIISEVFESEDAVWRGIGLVENSGTKFKKEYEEFDVEKFFNIPKIVSKKETSKCRCAEVLIGKIEPYECPLFEKVCTPQNPMGACMVSSEGSCAAYYKYER